MTTLTPDLTTPYGPLNLVLEEADATTLRILRDDVEVATGPGPSLAYVDSTMVPDVQHIYRGESYAGADEPIGVDAVAFTAAAAGTPAMVARPIGRPEVDGWAVSMYGLTNGTTYRLYRYNAKTRTPVYLANPFATPASGTPNPYVITDFHYPIGEDFAYRLYRAGTRVADTRKGGNPWYRVNYGLPILRRGGPGGPSTAMEVTIKDQQSIEYRSRMAVHEVINRPDPVGIGTYRYLARGTITFLTRTVDERDALLLLLREGTKYLLRTPCHHVVDDMWFVAWDIREARVSDTSARKTLEVEYQRVRGPGEGEEPLPTPEPENNYGEVDAAYPTFDAVYVSNVSYADVLANTPIVVRSAGVEPLEGEVVEDDEQSEYADQVWQEATYDA